jgi:hypothetical protein
LAISAKIKKVIKIPQMPIEVSPIGTMTGLKGDCDLAKIKARTLKTNSAIKIKYTAALYECIFKPEVILQAM